VINILNDLSIFLTFVGHLPLVKAFRFVGQFVWDRKKPEVVCDEAINEISGDDFSWSLRAIFRHVVLLNGPY
jgi:3-deoxy-D-arabino-heptulosonate 7-phosphate (DAHP) synthase class II